MNVDAQAALDFVNEMERVQIAGYPPTSRDYDELRRILTTPRAPVLPNYGGIKR